MFCIGPGEQKPSLSVPPFVAPTLSSSSTRSRPQALRQDVGGSATTTQTTHKPQPKRASNKSIESKQKKTTVSAVWPG